MDPITRNGVDGGLKNGIEFQIKRKQQIFEHMIEQVAGKAFLEAFRRLSPQEQSKQVDAADIPNMLGKMEDQKDKVESDDEDEVDATEIPSMKEDQKDNVPLDSDALEDDEEVEDPSDKDDLLFIMSGVESLNLINEKVTQLEKTYIIAKEKEDSFSDRSSSC